MKYYSSLIIAFFFVFLVNAQEQEQQLELETPSYAFSHKKTAYVTLKDGKEIKGNIQDIDRDKGLIELVKIKDAVGKKHKLKPNEIQHMYLPPSGLDKIGNAHRTIFKAKNWTDQKIQENLINQGYVYFEQTQVKIKKRTETLLAQLLNPTFSGKIKVYHDPKAKETMSLGIGGVDVAGGILKSYYIKKETDAAAYKLTKKDYQKQFKMFWSDCDELVKEFGSDPHWRDLTVHIHKYYGYKK